MIERPAAERRRPEGPHLDCLLARWPLICDDLARMRFPKTNQLEAYRVEADWEYGRALRRWEAEQRRAGRTLAPESSLDGQRRSDHSEGSDAGHEPAGAKQAEAIDELARQKAIANLPRAIRRAFLAFEAVARKKEKRLEDLEDHEAHKLLMEEGVPDDADERGERTDYKPPRSVGTFRKYLSTARHELGEQKKRSRRGRAHGKSIVRQDQIEPRDNDDG